MRTETIVFDGNEYECRIVTDNEGNDQLIAPLSLLDAVCPHGADPETKEGTAVDELVFFYTDADNLSLDDAELIDAICNDGDLHEFFDAPNN